MQSKLIHEADGQKASPIILNSGSEVMECHYAFARTEQLSAANFKAIGASAVSALPCAG